MRLLTAFAAVLALSACGGGADDDDDDGTQPPVMPAVLDVGPTSGTIDVPFTVAITGTASELGAVAFADDVGTLEGGAQPGFLYQISEFEGYTLYQGMAVAPDRWMIFWLYCQGTTFVGGYYESVDGDPMTYAPGTGTCSGDATPRTIPVSLPAFSIPTPAYIGGYEIDGPDMSLDASGDGVVMIGGVPRAFVTFQDVVIDGGWYELHSVVWDAANESAAFAIFYLILGNEGEIQPFYSLALPELEDTVGNPVLDADWTVQ